jgi:hypothetical protein
LSSIVGNEPPGRLREEPNRAQLHQTRDHLE